MCLPKHAPCEPVDGLPQGNDLVEQERDRDWAGTIIYRRPQLEHLLKFCTGVYRCYVALAMSVASVLYTL